MSTRDVPMPASFEAYADALDEMLLITGFGPIPDAMATDYYARRAPMEYVIGDLAIRRSTTEPRVNFPFTPRVSGELHQVPKPAPKPKKKAASPRKGRAPLRPPQRLDELIALMDRDVGATESELQQLLEWDDPPQPAFVRRWVVLAGRSLASLEEALTARGKHYRLVVRR